MSGVGAVSFAAQGEPVMLIQPDGRIFWRGREVESDETFRAAMLDVAKYLQANAQGSVPVSAYSAVLGQLEALEARALGAEANARRYEWLRERVGVDYRGVFLALGNSKADAAETDAAIDAAALAGRGVGGG